CPLLPVPSRDAELGDSDAAGKMSAGVERRAGVVIENAESVDTCGAAGVAGHHRLPAVVVEAEDPDLLAKRARQVAPGVEPGPRTVVEYNKAESIPGEASVADLDPARAGPL